MDERTRQSVRLFYSSWDIFCLCMIFLYIYALIHGFQSSLGPLEDYTWDMFPHTAK